MSRPEAAGLRQAGFGVWLPAHLILPLKLMRALRKAEFGGFALIAPFPDVVNCVLGRLGLVATSGVGNLDEIVPKLRLLAADRLGAPCAEIQVTLVAHHALEPAAFGEAVDELPPFFLRIEHNHRDVTPQLRGDELLTRPYPLPTGPPTHFLTAGSAIRLIRALLSEGTTRLHAPGPKAYRAAIRSWPTVPASVCRRSTAFHSPRRFRSTSGRIASMGSSESRKTVPWCSRRQPPEHFGNVHPGAPGQATSSQRQTQLLVIPPRRRRQSSGPVCRLTSDS